MADSKLADLTEITTPATTDILYLVQDPAGTPVDRKVTVADLRGASAAGVWHLEIAPMFALANLTHVGTWTAAADANQIGGFYMRNATSAQNDELNLGSIQLDAGTYDLEVFGVTHNDQGKIHLILDGVDTGTPQDTYSASLTYNVKKAFTGFTVATTGAHTVKLKVADKNASSSSYLLRITQLVFRRTA